MKKIEKLVNSFFKTEKIGIAIAMTFPPKYNNCSWITNFSREDGANLFICTAEKMLKDNNIKKNQKADMN
jgi:hypothetical protein